MQLAHSSTWQNVLISGWARTRVSMPTPWWCSVAVVIRIFVYREP
jgi:hypothetical protein